MPIIVTDADVLAEVQADDGAANAIDASITALGDKVPPAMRANWTAYLAGYRAWSKTTTDAVNGGFLGGAWFGVPELGDQAVVKARELAQWQGNINAIAAGQSAPVGVPAVDPNVVAADNASIPGLTTPPSTSTQVLIGLGLLAVLYGLTKVR